MKYFFKILKKVIFSAFLLYGYNLLASPINLVIPINIFTVLSVCFLGIPAILSLVFLLISFY